MALERLLVTGGSGFIGSAVARGLVADGHDVTSLDQTPCPVSGVDSVVGDLRDERVRQRALAGDIAGIVHLAAATSVVGSLSDPMGVFTANVMATAALLENARTRGVTKFVMSSTNAIVGEVGRDLIDESVPPRPLTPYGATKAAGEMLLSAYSGSYAMAAGALRLTNVYGPGMSHKDSFVARLMRAARAGRGVQIYGDGSAERDFVFVDDVVSAFLLAARRSLSGIVIVGSGESVTMLELVERVRRVTGEALPVEHLPPRVGEMSAVRVDLTNARRFGFEPSVGLDDGLAAVWEEAQSRWDEDPVAP